MLSAASQVHAPGTGDTPVPSGSPLQSPCVTRVQGHFLGSKDKPVVPTEIVHGKGIVWIKLDLYT